MSVAGWVSCACVLALVLVLALVARDRNRLQQRMDNAEGAVTGLTADLDATRELVSRLQTYLGTASSWDVDASAPPSLTAPADRWSSAPPRSPDGVATHDAAPPAGGRGIPSASGFPSVPAPDAQRPSATA